MKKKISKKTISKKRRSKKLFKKQKAGNNEYSSYSIVFTNLFQNGDLYISSQFIIDIKNKVNNDIKYYVKLSGSNNINPENFEYINVPLFDITTNTQYKDDKKKEFIRINNETKEIIVNTWVGSFKSFINGNDDDDVNLPLYYNQFKELYTLLNIQIENIDFYIPSFNQPSFTKYNDKLQTIKSIYDIIKKKKVLICNGNGYSANTTLDPKIVKFFIDNNYFVKVTNETAITDPTILEAYKKNIEEYSKNDIITKDSLLYINNIIASQSDIIVGLASGLLITTYSKETLNKKFIMISSVNHIVYEKFNSKWIKNDNVDAIIKEIETNINI